MMREPFIYEGEPEFEPKEFGVDAVIVSVLRRPEDTVIHLKWVKMVADAESWREYSLRQTERLCRESVKEILPKKGRIVLAR